MRARWDRFCMWCTLAVIVVLAWALWTTGAEYANFEELEED